MIWIWLICCGNIFVCSCYFTWMAITCVSTIVYLLSFCLLLSQPINHIQLYKKVKVIYVENFPLWDGLPFILLNQKELYNSIGMTTNNTNKTLEKYTMHIVYVGSKPKAMTPFNLKTCVMLCLILKSKVKLYQNYKSSYSMHNSIMNSSINANIISHQIES